MGPHSHSHSHTTAAHSHDPTPTAAYDHCVQHPAVAACARRWHNHVCPSVNKEEWTAAEDQELDG